jgi:glutamate synthase (NADPH) small chain
MQTFFRTAQQYPQLRPADERREDFNEIYREFATEKARTQSERCLQCGVPFCQVHCPLHNNIPDWLRYTAEGRLRDAYEMAASTNSFPEICGRICPQDRLCEGNCVVGKGFGAITIGAVEKYITEVAWAEGWVLPFAPAHENGQSVGIIGSGPAGLAAAERLRRAGFAVHIYDRSDRAGGLLMYGIPNFKLDKTVVTRRIQQFEMSGVVFHLGVDIGGSLSFEDVRSRHDAVLIATGVYQAREMDISHSNQPNIHKALDFLTESNRASLNANSPSLSSAHKHVVVVGGGDTAMDCVRTAIRQQAASVTCLYRRDRDNMPGSAREVKHAEDEGVTFSWLSAPARFHGEARVEAMDIQMMRLGAADSSGRRLPTPINGNVCQIPADMVIAALGFEPEPLPALFGAPDLCTTSRGTLTIDGRMMTSLEGVFAAGDIVRGASLVVWAIADGRDVAAHMMRYLESGIGNQESRKVAS